MTNILFTAYDEHTEQVRDFTRQVIGKLVNEQGANYEEWRES